MTKHMPTRKAVRRITVTVREAVWWIDSFLSRYVDTKDCREADPFLDFVTLITSPFRGRAIDSGAGSRRA